MQARWIATCLVSFLSVGIALSVKAAGDGFFDKFDQFNRVRWDISDGWTNGDHQDCQWSRRNLSIGGDGLDFVLDDKGGKIRPYACPEIKTSRRYGYGFYEVRMRAAAGSGLNTAFFTYTGPPLGVPQHDEIDIEFLGKDTHTLNAGYSADSKWGPGKVIPLDFDAAAAFHNYAFEWTPQKIRWYVDGKILYETPDGAPIPHQPGGIYLSLWNGTKVEDSWLGAFSYSNPAKAAYAWTSFTPLGEKCLFRESVTCKLYSPRQWP